MTFGRDHLVIQSQTMSLADLYAAFQTVQNNEQAAALTAQCNELHKNPEVLFQQVAILSQCDQPFVRQQAAIGMKTVLSHFWKDIAATPEAQQFKASVLEILANEKTSVVVDVVLTALEPIFMDIRNNPWPELLSFVEKLMGSSDDSICLTVLMKLFYMWIPAMTEQEFAGFHDAIGHLITKAMSKGEEPLFIVAVQLFSQTVSMFSGGFSPMFNEILKQVLSAFHMALTQNWGMCNVFANMLERVVESCNGAFDVTEFVNVLIGMMGDPAINAEVAFHVFGPIDMAVMTNFKAVKRLIPEIVRLAMTVGACYLADDECFSEEISTAEYVMQVVGVLGQYYDSEKLYEIVSSFIGTESPGQIYVSLLAIDIFLTDLPDVAVENAASFAKFLIGNLDAKQHHTLRETALYALPQLLELLGENMNDYSDAMVEACSAAIDSGHPQLVFLGTRALAMVLSRVRINQKFVGVLYEKLMAILGQVHEMQTEVLSALASLINAAEDGIKPYVEQLARVAIDAAQVSEERAPILKARAIEALGKLLYIAPEQMQAIAVQCLELLAHCRESKDGSVVTSLLISMATVTSATYPGIDEFLTIARDYALSELDLDHARQLMESDAFDPEEDQNVNAVLIEVIANAMSVIDQLAIDKPAILAPKAEDALNAIVNLTQFENSIMREKAAGAIVSMICAYGLNANVIVQSLDHMFVSFDPLSVRAAFDMCEELARKKVDMTAETLSAIFEYAMQGVTRKLDCLECGRDDEGDDVAERFDMKLMKSVFGFLDAFAALGPAAFDAAKRQRFLEAVHNNMKKERKLETVMATKVLGGLFEHCRAEISGLQMKVLMSTVVQSLLMCDGNVRPEGLVAVRRIFDSDASAFSNDVGKIIEMVIKILDLPNEGQAFYRKTAAAASSVLFTILRIQPGALNVELLKPMLAVLPPACEQVNIYCSLVAVFEQSKDIFVPVADALVAGLARTLCLQDSPYKKMGLSDETSAKLVAILTCLLQSVPNAEGILQEAVGDPTSFAKLQARIGSA